MSTAAAAAAIANAIKASGTLVEVEPDAFETILRKCDKPLVILAPGGFFSKKYKYLTSYKGFAFFTKSSEPMSLPAGTEAIVASQIWMP